MAMVITGACMDCGACLGVCPESCINEADGVYTVDAARCTDCGACARICPAGACVPGPKPRGVTAQGGAGDKFTPMPASIEP